MKWADHLMKKWGIKSKWDFCLIMLVFSLAGMSVVYVRKPAFALMGVGAQTPFLLKTFFYLLVIFPTYQINLLIWGFILGQSQFFWEKEKA